MSFPIKDKEDVLTELEASLHLCEVVLKVSLSNGEPPEARTRGTLRRDCFREAIRFIQEHAT